MSFLDEAIYDRDNSRDNSRENSLERNIFGDGLDSDKDNDNKDGDGDKEKVDAKKVVKKRISTQPRLNPDRLCGARGIIDVENYFKNIHFKGKNHELEDLTNIMKRLEHWSHRLFPKYTFDDCLFQIERLGRKKQIHHYLNRYRLNELDENKENDNIVDSGGSDDEFSRRDNEMHAFDEMDEMIAEQLSKTAHSLPQQDTSFDDLGVHPLDTTTESEFFNGLRGSQRSQTVQAPPVSTPQITEEQKRLIEQDRLKALERLKQRKLNTQTQNSPMFSSTPQRHGFSAVEGRFEPSNPVDERHEEEPFDDDIEME